MEEFVCKNREPDNSAIFRIALEDKRFDVDTIYDPTALA
jgi:hypothetical protein